MDLTPNLKPPLFQCISALLQYIFTGPIYSHWPNIFPGHLSCEPYQLALNVSLLNFNKLTRASKSPFSRFQYWVLAKVAFAPCIHQLLSQS